MLVTEEQIRYYTQAYLFLFTEANSTQIADFLNNQLLKLEGEQKIDKDYISDLLVNSSLFLSNKSRNSILIFRLKDELY